MSVYSLYVNFVLYRKKYDFFFLSKENFLKTTGGIRDSSRRDEDRTHVTGVEGLMRVLQFLGQS